MEHEDTKSQIINNLISAINEKKVYCASCIISGYIIQPKNDQNNRFTIRIDAGDLFGTPHPATISLNSKHGKMDLDENDPLFNKANELYNLVISNSDYESLLNDTLDIG